MKEGLRKWRNVIIFTVLIALVVSYYAYISNRSSEQKTEAAGTSEVQALVSRDIEKNYPGTPREVVKLYSSIIKLYYKTDIKLTDEEIESLARQARLLLDDELLSKNSEETYLANLKAEITSYKEEEKYISDYTIEKANNVEYKTFQKKEYAIVDALYYLRKSSTVINTYETYTLRKDSDGKWKILFWELATPSDVVDE